MLFAQHLSRLAAEGDELDEASRANMQRPAQEALMKLFAVRLHTFLLFFFLLIHLNLCSGEYRKYCFKSGVKGCRDLISGSERVLRCI